MIRIAPAIVVLASCAFASAAALAGDSPKTASTEAALMQGNGINLMLYSSNPTFGKVEDPTFWVHAARGQLLDAPRVWSLEDARAVIYRDPEEDLVLVAKSGTFDETHKAAQLDGGVRVTSGKLAVDTERIQWDNETRIAKSDSTTTLNDGVNQIVGNSISIYPDENRVKVSGGSASIQLAEALSETKEDKDKPADASQFKEIRIEKYQEISGNLKGSPIEEIKGPVRMVLIGKLPEDSITINSDLVRLEFAGGSTERTPSHVMLRGNVEIVQISGSIRANDADLDFETGKATFTGDVKMTGDRLNGANVPLLEMNLKTGEYHLKGPGDAVSIDTAEPEKAKEKKQP